MVLSVSISRGVGPIWLFFSFVLTLFFVLFCELYLDSGSFLRRDIKIQERSFWTRNDSESECDWYDGEWVWDQNYPLYESKDCRFLDPGFRCSENGRPDKMYTNWRWQPKHCDLPRFNGKEMLEKLRNKRLVFAGDSIGRNQWESLLCLLSSAVANRSSIYEINGRPITEHTGYLIFKFEEYNCTVEYYRSPFLIVYDRAPPGAPEKVKATLKLDQIEWMREHWRDSDVIVFNAGHWWTYEKTIRAGRYFQEGDELKLEMSVDEAYRKSIKTLFDWLNREVNPTKTQVIFRTYSPSHFSGDWRKGGNCHKETVPELASHEPSLKPWTRFFDPLSKYSKNYQLDILNITQMTARRKDGHSSIFRPGKAGPAALHRQDCSHWCLPGVPDAWNELLYAVFMKREVISKVEVNNGR